MEYTIIGIVAVIVIVVGMMIFLRLKKNISDVITENAEKVEEKTALQSRRLQEPPIQIEILRPEAIPDDSKLVEITDSKVLAHVNNLVPGLGQVGNLANNAAQAVQGNGEVLYRAIIPNGAKLANSKTMEGAVRGIYHGSGGIKGSANLVAVEAQYSPAFVANTAAVAMGVASLVVGQYYMTQINAKLGDISDGLSKISDFQDNEYRSRVFSLVAHVKKIADFQVEILENQELRFSKISQLDSLEEECTQLLEQANLALRGYTKKNDLNYTVYEKELPEVDNWYMYQVVLLDVLHKISELRYTLYLGAVSRENCASLLSTYTNKFAESQSRLKTWHEAAIERFSIDTSKVRRKRTGLDRVVHHLPGLYKEERNFKSIEKSTVRMIETQSAVRVYGNNTSDLYAEDVQLISKGGKVYYLPTDCSRTAGQEC